VCFFFLTHYRATTSRSNDARNGGGESHTLIHPILERWRLYGPRAKKPRPYQAGQEREREREAKGGDRKHLLGTLTAPNYFTLNSVKTPAKCQEASSGPSCRATPAGQERGGERVVWLRTPPRRGKHRPRCKKNAERALEDERSAQNAHPRKEKHSLVRARARAGWTREREGERRNTQCSKTKSDLPSFSARRDSGGEETLN